MELFKTSLLRNRTISVWGIGYLGYTTILRLQANGFFTTVSDFTGDKLQDFANKNYPTKSQMDNWSKSGIVQQVDISKIEIAENKNLMFKNNLHIISFPNRTSSEDYNKLAFLFLQHKKELENSLIIFQSVGTPKDIESSFINKLSIKNIDIATIFRSDWTIEDFFAGSQKRVISSNTNIGIKKTQLFLSMLEIESIILDNIETAEVYENSKNGLTYTISAFFNQLSLAYPHINIQKVSKQILSNLDVQTISLGISGVDYKSEEAIKNIFTGSKNNYLSILKEANSTNLSFLLNYVNFLKNKDVKSVTIIGLASHGGKKDLRFSPSIILAEYLQSANISTFIYDSDFNKNELLEILPHSKYMDIVQDGIYTDAVIVMKASNKDKFISQQHIENNGLFNIKFILDNTNLLNQFKFSENTIYHQFGDNNLVKLVD